ncbi:hypothetical protein Pmani_001641 [Petrolisthes manimaculis]|uniref:Endothelin-converting enzyme 1 n=1 Tax=Petrolisthes manimaculis TaxID=1843537 RepID=A0AAE1UP83_9EUCA|nr:hypothetical protein Pmani_001641 [Petrolisthes manimaculis]
MMTSLAKPRPLTLLVVILLAAHLASPAPTHTTRENHTSGATHRPTSQPSWHLLLALWRPKETAAPTTLQATSTLPSSADSSPPVQEKIVRLQPLSSLTDSRDFQGDDPSSQSTEARHPMVMQDDSPQEKSSKADTQQEEGEQNSPTSTQKPNINNSERVKDEVINDSGPGKWMNKHLSAENVDGEHTPQTHEIIRAESVAREASTPEQQHVEEDSEDSLLTVATETPKHTIPLEEQDEALHPLMIGEGLNPQESVPSETDQVEDISIEDDDQLNSPELDDHFFVHPFPHHREVMEEEHHSTSISSSHYPKTTMTVPGGSHYPKTSTTQPETAPHTLTTSTNHSETVSHYLRDTPDHAEALHSTNTSIIHPKTTSHNYTENTTHHQSAPHRPKISMSQVNTAPHDLDFSTSQHETPPHHPKLNTGTIPNLTNFTTSQEPPPHHPKTFMTNNGTLSLPSNFTTLKQSPPHHPKSSTTNTGTTDFSTNQDGASRPHHPLASLAQDETPSEDLQISMTLPGTYLYGNETIQISELPQFNTSTSLSEAGEDDASQTENTDEKVNSPTFESNRGDKILELHGPVMLEPLDEPSLVPLVGESKEILTMKDDEKAVLALLRVAQGSGNLEDPFHVNSRMQPGETSDLQPESPSMVQPMDHSVNHPVDQSALQPSDLGILQPVDHSIVQPADYSGVHPVDHSAIHPADHSVIHPVDHSIVQPVDHARIQPENSANPEEQLASTIITSHRSVTSGPDDVADSQRSHTAKLVPTAMLIKKGTKVLDSRKAVNALDSRDKSGEVPKESDASEEPELQTTAKPIYEEISDTLKVDTSIDDVEDFDVQVRHTENTDEFLPPTNQSHTNLIDVTLHHPSSTTGVPTDFPALPTTATTTTSTSTTNPTTTTTTTASPPSPTPHTYSDYPSHYPPKLSTIQQDLQDSTATTATEEEDGAEGWPAFIGNMSNAYVGNISSLSSAGLTLNESMLQKTLELSLDEHYRMVLQERGSLMLQLMDPSTDPCDDFYQFACGKWNGKFPIRQDKAVDNTFERLKEDLDDVLRSLLEEPPSSSDNNITKSVKTLYTGCMNTDAIEELGAQPLLDLLRELGGWPVLQGDEWDDTGYDWVRQMAHLRNYNNDILVSEWVAADITNSSNHIIQLDQPELGLPGREYFINPGDYLYREAYMNLMLQVTQMLGAPLSSALLDMTDVLHFEQQISRILTAAEERRNLSAVHRRMTLQELQDEVSEIDWESYLEIITWNNTQMEEVVVFGLDYFKKLVSLLKDTNNRTISNYLMWRFVKNRISNLGESYTNVKQDYIKVLFGRKSQPERWRSCVTYVSGNLGYVVGAMFVKRYFPEASKNDTHEMIGLIRESFRTALDEARWMHEDTRKVAQEKVDTIVKNVGYPDYLLNDTYMDQVYYELSFKEDTHFENVLKMLQFHARTNHNQLSVPVNRTAWVTSPAVVNAYYSRSKNMIVFPAGILQPPFYHPAFPRSLNYGGIGVVIGHEITHGFDDRGRQFDKNGNLQQWWKAEDVSKFYQRASCMLDQYGEYKVDEVGLKINPVNTLGENIADNAGIKISYQAYKTWRETHDEEVTVPYVNLTHDQLFFLNFGQIWCEVNSPEAMLTKLRSGQHSPNKFRVIGTLSNSEEFSEAFNCPVGSRMNPERKCRVW